MADEVHYAATRQSLWNAATAMETEALEADRQMEVYQSYANDERKKAVRLRDRAEHLRIAAETLGQLDKSGLVLKVDKGRYDTPVATGGITVASPEEKPRQ